PPYQFAPGHLRAGGAAYGTRDPDATSKKRRLRRGLWRCGHGKHFWRTNHKRVGEVHGMSGWHLFRAHLCIVDTLRPYEHGRQRLPPRADETTNFSSGASRHAIAGLVLSAPVRCQRFARQQRKPRGARNFAYFIASGEAVALLLQLIMFRTIID